VELPQAALVTEVQFDSAASGSRGGRATLAPAPAPGAPPGPAGRGAMAGGASAIGYPRAYSVTVSADGRKWSKPGAPGVGAGAGNTTTFAPTRAQFVRTTQTDTLPDAPPWSIRNLRVYEAHASADTK